MPENTNQPELKIAEDLDLFQQEWKGMPEFVMTPEKPFRTIKLHFKTKEAVEQFQQLFDQKIHENYENYWFPKLNRKAFSDEFYTDAT